MSDHLTSHTAKPDISKANACPPLPSNASLADKVVYWLGIGLGSGLPKRAPGTWGTVGGLIAAIPLMMLGFVPFLIITIIASVVGIWICGRTSDLMGVHDDPHIVWDEWAGMWITLLPFSYIGFNQLARIDGLKIDWIIIIVAFILFRFFDILKPFPINWADKKVSGGLGIMLDDILAGIMSVIVMLLLSYGLLLLVF